MRQHRATPLDDEDLASALVREKSRFVAANIERCGYLKVLITPEPADKSVVITASFTLDGTRRWHKVETAIDAERSGEEDVKAAFRRLADGIGAARIAGLFKPLGPDVDRHTPEREF